jgi:hypothetical protein
MIITRNKNQKAGIAQQCTGKDIQSMTVSQTTGLTPAKTQSVV